MHYDPDNSEVIPFTKYEHNDNENPLEKRHKSARFCFNLIIIAYICAISALITFITFLTMRLDQMIEMNNLEIILPFLLFLIFTDLLGNKMIAHPSNNLTGLGRFFLYFTHNTCCLFIFLFVLILGFRLDDNITLKFGFIFIPLDLIFAIMFLFICFIFPGLLDKNIAMYQEAFLISAYYLITLITVILLTVRLDEIIKWNYYKLFLPILIMMFMHWLLILKNLFNNRVSLELELLKLSTLLVIIVGIILPILKCDGIVAIGWKVAFIPLYLLIIILAIQSSRSFLNLYKNDDQEI